MIVLSARIYGVSLGLIMGLSAFSCAAQVIEIGEGGQAKILCTAAQNRPDLTSHLSVSAARSIPPSFRAAIDQAASLYELSPDLIDTLIRQESGYNPKALSPKGAIGLMQLMPQTAKMLHIDAHDVTQNILGGAAYLRYLLNAYNGQIDLALAAYNSGQGAVAKYGGIPPYKETVAYVKRNLEFMAQKSDTEPQIQAPLPPQDSAYIVACHN